MESEQQHRDQSICSSRVKCSMPSRQPFCQVLLKHKINHFQTLPATQHKYILTDLLLCNVRPTKGGVLWFLWTNISTTKHGTTKLITSFTQNQLHILMISISHVMKNTQNWWKSPYYRLDVSSKFCHFCNVLETPNNPHQQTRHLELNRMAQTISS